MIPKECKRLAEVDFPIAVVSKHAAREKSVRHGHPSTLHLWWARRPLAACRAMLLALLLPDPCDKHCPEEFKRKARVLLPPVVGPVGSKDDDLRSKLLKFIGDFANWDHAANPTFLSVGRDLVAAAHPGETPLVVDPFAGGGSIPLEALRLSCDTFASDLNPVATFILRTLLEHVPRHGPALAEELENVCNEIGRSAANDLAEFYPADPDGARPIAYLWARTVRCEAPDCGAEVPIYRSAWLSRKGASRARYFKEADDGSCVALIITSAPKGGPIKFRIARGHGREHATSGFQELRGTKAPGNNANVLCPCCGTILPGTKSAPRTVNQLAAQNGGANTKFDAEGKRVGGAWLLAVVTQYSGQPRKHYRLPTDHDYFAVRKAVQAFEQLSDPNRSKGLDPLPSEPLPPIGTLGFRVQRYGVTHWRDLFTARQNLALSALAKNIASRAESRLNGLLGCLLGRCADYWSAGAMWAEEGEFVAHTFGRQALPMVWDFAETAPWAGSSGSFDSAVDWIRRVIDATPIRQIGQVQVADAAASPLPSEVANVWFTDPPYYDAVPYADLSDFFFVWLKRALPGDPYLCDPWDEENPLSPKIQEIVEDKTKTADNRPKDSGFFEEGMFHAFMEGRRVINPEGIGSVVFAHKSTEGWEALLSGLIRPGWTVTASWPIATERPGRLRSQNSAALATSVHLVCRPRDETAGIGDWSEVLRELPARVGDWMERLQGEAVRGADLVFACIGPALEVFSRYERVETADGREVELPEYLEKVWEVVGRTALEQILGTVEAQARNGLAGALEEDARLTALFLWTIQSTNGESASNDSEEVAEDEELDEEEETPRRKSKGYSLIFDVARRFAQPLGIRLPDWEGRIIETSKGVVRLMAVTERGKQLFGESGAGALADEIEASPLAAAQLTLFPEETPVVRGRGRRRGRTATVAAGDLETSLEATTLDRVHAAMLLQASGRSQALRNLLKAEQERGPDFLRLANALSALYPRGSEEKRLLDAMLLAVPR